MLRLLETDAAVTDVLESRSSKRFWKTKGKTHVLISLF